MYRFLILALCVTQLSARAVSLEPIPEKLVVLTFDDSVKSHFTVVRPILLKYGFGATFFITEGFDFPTNKTDYMTWEQIKQLHADGFEIGNHTRDHMGVTPESLPKLEDQLAGINIQCRKHGIPVEMHLFPDGRHGLGLAKNTPGAAAWSELCAQWLRGLGIVKEATDQP